MSSCGCWPRANGAAAPLPGSPSAKAPFQAWEPSRARTGIPPTGGRGTRCCVAASGSVIAYTPDTPTQSGWLYAVGVRARRDSTTSPTVTIGVYQASSGGTPTDLDQQTASFVVTSGSFAEYVRDLAAAVTLAPGTANRSP